MSKNTQNYHIYPFTSKSKVQESTQKLFSWIDEQKARDHNLCHRKCKGIHDWYNPAGRSICKARCNNIYDLSSEPFDPQKTIMESSLDEYDYMSI
ncbi:MAG: hypothetical protein AB3P11_05495 [Wolbachia pipientis]